VRADVFAVSGRAEPQRIAAGKKRALANGWSIVDHAPSGAASGYLAGDDQIRRDSLKQAVDSTGDFLWALRGGYGASRLVPFAQEGLARRPLVGFSDLVILLAAVHRLGGTAIHGPVLTSFADADPASVADLGAALRCEPRTWSLTSAATVAAPLLGGNLEILSRLIGTDAQPRFAGHIVILEDVGEPWYRCDRALTHLLQATDFGAAAAVIFGEFLDCEAATSERLAARLDALGIGCASGAPVGHGVANQAFIWGEIGELSADQLLLTGQAVE
jgi:muramoyltetrapeptide carboxypeptidase